MKPVLAVYTKTEMWLWRNFHQWLHWKLTTSSAASDWHFRKNDISVCVYTPIHFAHGKCSVVFHCPVITVRSSLPTCTYIQQTYVTGGEKARLNGVPREQGSRGQHGTHLGPVGSRRAPCWPHKPCYEGCARFPWCLALITLNLGKHKNIFSVSIICHTHDDVIKWKRFPRNWSCVRGIYRPPVNSPHKGQWCGVLMFSLICTRTSVWVSDRDTGDFRRHRAYYDVTVMRDDACSGYTAFLMECRTTVIPHC